MPINEPDGWLDRARYEWPKPSPGILLSDSQIARVVAAARREGWAQAIEALRDEALWQSRRGTMPHPPHSMAIWMAGYLDSIDRPEYPLASGLTDRAAALTEEGQ